MRVKYKKVSIAMPHCGECKEMLTGNDSIFNPYTCACGTWKSDWSNPSEYKLVDTGEFVPHFTTEESTPDMEYETTVGSTNSKNTPDGKSFFDLSDKEQKEILDQAADDSNQAQQEIVDKYNAMKNTGGDT